MAFSINFVCIVGHKGKIQSQDQSVYHIARNYQYFSMMKIGQRIATNISDRGCTDRNVTSLLFLSVIYIFLLSRATSGNITITTIVININTIDCFNFSCFYCQ